MAYRKVEASPTLSLNELSHQLQQDGQTIYRFGFGQSPFTPLERVKHAFQEAVHRIDYLPVQGLPELRERVATFHSETDGYDISADQIIVASGSKILLYNFMNAFENAVVYLPAPSWVSYGAQAQLIGHAVELIHTTFEDRWRLDPDALDHALSDTTYAGREKILVLNYPGNPDGLVYTEDELLALTEVLRKHQAWVLADEIYALLHHTGEHISLASYYPERTTVTSGLSKWSGAGGWRLGIQIMPPNIPKDLKQALLAIGSSTYSCATAPVQFAACQAYVLDDETQNYLTAQRNILSEIGQQVYQSIASGGIRVHQSQGAFYLMLDFSPMRGALAEKNIHTDIELCDRLLRETGVALLPGSAFNYHADALTARLAYVDFNGNQLLQATMANSNASVDTQQLQSTCQRMIIGLQAMLGWLPR